MPAPVHALAQCSLSPAAVAEFLALPRQPVSGEEFDVLDAAVRARGWSREHDCLTDAYRTGFGHLLCTEGNSPSADPAARRFLAFGELCPLDPDDEDLANLSWLGELVDDWGRAPGWTVRRPSTVEACVEVLDRAADAVTAHLGSPAERTVTSDAAVVTGPAMPHRIWRTDTEAVIVGPHADNGPYGYLTHLQLAASPLGLAPELPPADDTAALDRWIETHVDW
ncbi:hypothetical protein EV562_10190 [Streptomyces sp. BK208]|uniref:hypothetical protein n=1 Tax=Streptomyces sp. BK208 TaxID=2512150 RepID=UPI0010DB5EA8|nr:hypothetical protein [Streptomyces sp. BK208]TDT42121.1 hypothetical protein EV562_10190 [Streptomyces sp. BK208]